MNIEEQLAHMDLVFSALRVLNLPEIIHLRDQLTLPAIRAANKGQASIHDPLWLGIARWYRTGEPPETDEGRTLLRALRDRHCFLYKPVDELRVGERIHRCDGARLKVVQIDTEDDGQIYRVSVQSEPPTAQPIVDRNVPVFLADRYTMTVLRGAVLPVLIVLIG